MVNVHFRFPSVALKRHLLKLSVSIINRRRRCRRRRRRRRRHRCWLTFDLVIIPTINNRHHH